MDTNFDMLDRKEGEITIIEVKGELDALVAPKLKEKISKEIENGETKFIIDFKELLHINSLAMGILRGKLKSARALGGDIKLSNLNSHIKSIFEMIGLDEIFEIFESEEEALNSFKK